MRLVREGAFDASSPRMFTQGQVLLAIGACLMLCLFGGCYDSAAMIEATRDSVLKSRDVEVDLGTFQTTMPRDAETNAFTDLSVHLYGAVPRYRASDVRKQLKADAFRVRHSTLTALRDTTREELAEPDLTRFRARIEKVVNEVLADAPIKHIGFYDVRLEFE